MRSKRNHRVLAWCCTLPWALSFACISFQTTPRVVRPPTLGEELISLDQARKEGLLTQAEYDQRRAENVPDQLNANSMRAAPRLTDK